MSVRASLAVESLFLAAQSSPTPSNQFFLSAFSSTPTHLTMPRRPNSIEEICRFSRGLFNGRLTRVAIWPYARPNKSNLVFFTRSYHRRLLRIPWTQHKTNEWILCALNVDRELLDRVKSLKLRFYGHTTRKYESLEKEIVQGCVRGYRNRGRQRRRCTDDIAEWTGMRIDEAAAAAEDRDVWRLRAANPSQGRRH